MGLSTTHLIIFLVIIVVIFGTKKLRNISMNAARAARQLTRSDARRPYPAGRAPA